MVALTRSQVTKAGRLLRKMHRGEVASSSEQVRSALDVLVQFRASHSTPLTKANNGLRSMMATEGVQGRPTQRLKRTPTIIDKLVRHPTMALPNMQDIGGCRVVCTDIAQLRRLENRIRLNRPPAKAYDYISRPKSSGYRAVHLVVSYDERLIEIQLRTSLMHSWAVLQELMGALLSVDLKSGSGPQEVLEYMGLLSREIAAAENVESLDAELVLQADVARHRFLSYLESHLPPMGRLPGVSEL